MSGCIHSLRWVLAIFLLFFLFIFITIGIPMSAFSQSITNRDELKSWLEDSGVYEIVLDTVAENISQVGEDGAIDESGFQSELADPESETRKELETIVTPEKIKENADGVIDGLFDWFEGDTYRPEFEIKIADEPEDLISLFTIGLNEKISDLPECEPDYPPPEDFNPFEAECLPKGFDSSEIDAFFEENADSPEFEELMESTTISSDSLEVTPDTTQAVQSIFWVVKRLVFVALGIYVLLALALLLIIPGFPRKLYIIGSTTIIAAGLILAGTFFTRQLYDFAWQTLTLDIPPEYAETVEIVIGNLTDTAYVGVLSQMRVLSIITMIIGGAFITIGLLITIFRKREIAVLKQEMNQY